MSDGRECASCILQNTLATHACNTPLYIPYITLTLSAIHPYIRPLTESYLTHTHPYLINAPCLLSASGCHPLCDRLRGPLCHHPPLDQLSHTRDFRQCHHLSRNTLQSFVFTHTTTTIVVVFVVFWEGNVTLDVWGGKRRSGEW